MVNKNHWGSFTERKVAKTSFLASIAGLVIFALMYVSVPYVLAEVQAEGVITNLAWSTVFLELDTEDNVEFNGGTPITPTSATGTGNYGTMVVEDKTITVNTSAQNYSVFLSMSEDAADSALHRAEMSSLTIGSTSGTWGAGTNLTSNTWGYAVPASTVSGKDSGMAGSYTTGILYHDTTDANGTYTKKFAAVPLSNAPQMIYTDSTDNLQGFGTYTIDGTPYNGDTDNTFKVYYGVMVDTDMIAGEYSNEIVYTAFASPTALDEVSNNIGVNKHYVVAGDTLTLTFDLTSSIAGLVSDKTTVRVVPHADVAADNYEVGTTLTAKKDDYATCNYVSGNMASGAGSNYVCTLPSATLGADFDLWLEIAGYNYNYITKLEDSDNPGTYVGAIRYAGLSYDSDDNGTADSYILYMQDMTPSICASTNIWNDKTGKYARILYATGSHAEGGSLVGQQVIDETDPDTIARIDTDGDGALSDDEILIANAEMNVGTYALLDKRDEKPYLVRHLADGNCWMVQNLDLELAEFGATNPAGAQVNLTSTDSDVASSWDPYASTNTKINTTYAAQLAEADLTSDFTGLSNWLLGSPQAYQYQPQGTYGSNYYWGTKRTADDTVGTEVVNNAYSQVPRSYSNTTAAGAVQYRGANGITGAVGADGTTVGMNSTGWNSTDKTFYGSEYYGQYYNWYAATAETGTFAQTSGNASDSICPKGWQLPVNGGSTTNRSWQGLLFGNYKMTTDDGATFTAIASGAAGSLALRQIPLSIPFTGYYYCSNGALYGRGSLGYFWSSTAHSNGTYAYSLRFDGTGVYPQYGNNKVVGFSVRCVVAP